MGVGVSRKLCRSVGVALCLALPVIATAGAGVASANEPLAFYVSKIQSVKGSGAGFTNGPLVAVVGDTMEYDITLHNTGENRMVVDQFVDERCDAGTLRGGPGTNYVQPGHVSTYKCTHKVTTADQEAGVIENSATITGKRNAEEPKNIKTITSNTVVVNVPPGPVKPTFTVSATCESVTVNYTGFPEWTGNTVKEVVKNNGALAYEAGFTFDGGSGSSTTSLSLGAGAHTISAHATWNHNGVKGGATHTAKVTCP
jgi:hypothetical protein